MANADLCWQWPDVCRQCLTGTRYPTRPDNFWQYPIHTRFIFRIIGYFGYRVFHLFWPNVPVTIQYCFNPHNICQVWTCHQSSLQRIQFLKSYNRDVGTVIYKIMPIIWHCVPYCTHYFFFPRNMLFSHKFIHFCHDFFCRWDLDTILILFGAENLFQAIVLLLLWMHMVNR